MQNQNDQPISSHKELLSKNNGHPIKEETANRWMKTYKRYERILRSKQAPFTIYYFEKDVIMKLLNQENINIIGIRVYYSITDDGIYELIIYAVNDSGDDLSDNPVVRFDIEPIDQKTALKWRQNYENLENSLSPGCVVIRGHFYGKTCIEKLLKHKNEKKNEEASGMNIYYALTDDIEKELIILAGLSAGENMNTTYSVDFSHRCPPYC